MCLLHVLGILLHIKEWNRWSFETDFERWMCLQNFSFLWTIRGVEENLFLYMEKWPWEKGLASQRCDRQTHLIGVSHSHAMHGAYWLLKQTERRLTLQLSFLGTCVSGRKGFKYFTLSLCKCPLLQQFLWLSISEQNQLQASVSEAGSSTLPCCAAGRLSSGAPCPLMVCLAPWVLSAEGNPEEK